MKSLSRTLYTVKDARETLTCVGGQLELDAQHFSVGFTPFKPMNSRGHTYKILFNVVRHRLDLTYVLNLHLK